MLALRLLLVLLLAGVFIAVVVSRVRSFGHDGPPPASWLVATSSQSEMFVLRLDDGRPGRLMTEFTTRCPGGTDHFKWWPYGPFRPDHGRLTIRETTRHHYDLGDQTSVRTVTFAARFDHGALRGVATAVERFQGPRWGSYACESGPVTFSAG